MGPGPLEESMMKLWRRQIFIGVAVGQIDLMIITMVTYWNNDSALELE